MKRSTRSSDLRPSRSDFDIRAALRELAQLPREARRGGFNRTHLRRVQSAAWFVASDRRLFVLLFAFILPSMLLIPAGLPIAVPVVLIALPFALLSLALLCDTVSAFWENRIRQGMLFFVGAALRGLVACSGVVAGFRAPSAAPPNPALQPPPPSRRG